MWGTPPPGFLDLFIPKGLQLMTLDLRILKELQADVGVSASGSG